MLNQFSRTRLIFGIEAMEKLSQARVAVFGIGGVGSYTAEALVRSGIGAIDLIDDDRICLTNLNRQLFATRDTVGQHKVDVAEKRIRSINPDCKVITHKTFYMPDTKDLFDFTEYDYIVDAIDTVKGKLELVMNSKASETPIISSMGAGNKVNAAAFEVADIYETSVCPLARVMRYEPIRPLEDMSISCRKHCICPPGTARKCTQRRDIPGSTAFVPSAAGLIIAGEVIKDLIEFDRGER